jgi:hypothetical protein
MSRPHAEKKSISDNLKVLIRGLPIAAIVGASLLPFPNLSRQFLILAVLLWLQVFILFEFFLIDK